MLLLAIQFGFGCCFELRLVMRCCCTPLAATKTYEHNCDQRNEADHTTYGTTCNCTYAWSTRC